MMNKLHLALIVLVSVGAIAVGVRAYADQRRVVAQQQFVAVPTAVAVGVPVAVAAPGQGLYSLQQYAQQQSQAQADSTEELLAEFAAFIEWRKSRVKAQAKPSLLNQFCSKCHAPDETAKGGFRIDQLTPEARGKAIAAIASSRMPRDVPNLVSDIRLKLISELTGGVQAKQPPAEPKPE